MGIEDELQKSEQARVSEELQAAEELERKRVQGIRGERDQIKETRDKLAALLNDLQSGYSEAAQAQTDFKVEHERMTDLFKCYQVALAREGITSIDQMVKSENYGGQDEAVAYDDKSKTRRKKVGKVAEAKKGLREHLPEADLSFSGSQSAGQEKSNREQAIETIQAKLDKLDSQIWDLHIQTPEGQKEKEVKEAFVQELKSKNRVYNIGLYGEANTNMIQMEHLTIAQNYGDDYVRGEFKRYYHGRVDKEVTEKMRQENGLPELSTEVDNINSVEDNYNQAWRAERDLNTAYYEAVNALSGAIDADENLKARLAKRDQKSSRDMAMDHLDSLLSKTALARFSDKSALKLLQEELQEADKNMKGIGDLKSRSQKTEWDKHPKNIPTAELFNNLVERAKVLKDYINKLKIKIESEPASIVDESSPYEVGREVSNQRVEQKTFELSEDMRKMIQKESYHSTEKRIQMMEAQAAERGQIEKEYIDTNLARSWQEAELWQWENDNREYYEVEQKHTRISKDTAAATAAEKEISPLNKNHPRNELLDRLDDNLEIKQGLTVDGGGWVVISRELDQKVNDNSQELRRLNLEIEKIDQDIKRLEDSKDNVRGITRGSREKKRAAIDKLIEAQEELRKPLESRQADTMKAQNELQEKRAKITELNKFLNISDVGSRVTIALGDAGKETVTVREFFNDIVLKEMEEVRTRKLTSREQYVYDKHQEYKTAVTEAEEKHKQLEERRNKRAGEISHNMADLKSGKDLNLIDRRF